MSTEPVAPIPGGTNINNAKSKPLEPSFSAAGARQMYKPRRQRPDPSRARACPRSDSSNNVPELQAEDPSATGNWFSGLLDLSPLHYLFGILLKCVPIVSVVIAALSATGAVTNPTTAGLLRVIFGLAGKLLASVGSSVVCLAWNNDGSSATSFFRQLPRYDITHTPPSHGGLLEKASAQAYVLCQAHGNLVVLSWGGEDDLVDVFEVKEMAKVIRRNSFDTMSRYNVCHEEGNYMRNLVFLLADLGTAFHAQYDAREGGVTALGVDDHDGASLVWLKMTSWMPFGGGDRKVRLDRLQALVAHTESLLNYLVQHETELQNHGMCFSRAKKDLGMASGQVAKAREAVLLL
ncbi:hypothetical protein ColLi_12141 [Colletotrichum liriopes]|uniref:Uncharacterized protein n=1 Tax=Colletotrichum liriopes TaxID=708192 RepID=A0AA37H0E8_9PEZI|nr:hypothetical protein ColLi_12141 [Colletotrichum liriopes]